MLRRATLGLLLALPALLAGAGPARGALVFTANLTTDQEVPPVTGLTTDTGAPRPLSFGNATLVLNDAETALTMTVTIFNIDVTGTQTPFANDNLVNAHIHGPAAPGSNAPVRWGFFGTPDNDTSPKQLVVTPFSTGVGGTFTSVWDAPEGNATTLTAQLANLKAGLMYLNFHTVQFGGGEIRGQILPIPEPSSLALAGLGAAGLVLAARRRRPARG